MKPHIFHESIEVYLARLAPRGLPGIFERMHAEASRRAFPIVGPEAGRFFLQLSRLRRPRRILELGSGFGYSAIWFALGCGGDVEIHCTEYDQKNIDLGRQFALAAGIDHCLHWHRGDALNSAASLDGPWDLIFCDIDKEQYPAAYDFSRAVMRRGDLLVFDNVLWHGEVAKPQDEHDPQTRRVVELTNKAYADPAMDVSILPVRDGLLLAMKK